MAWLDVVLQCAHMVADDFIKIVYQNWKCWLLNVTLLHMYWCLKSVAIPFHSQSVWHLQRGHRVGIEQYAGTTYTTPVRYETVQVSCACIHELSFHLSFFWWLLSSWKCCMRCHFSSPFRWCHSRLWPCCYFSLYVAYRWQATICMHQDRNVHLSEFQLAMFCNISSQKSMQRNKCGEYCFFQT